MKKYIIIMIACAMCACGGNNPDEPQIDDMYSPLTESERSAIEKSIADNYDCFVSWLGGQSGDVLEIRRIKAAAQTDAAEIADDLGGCFGDKYAVFSDTIIDGKYIDKSYLRERIYIVELWSKWKFMSEAERRNLEQSGGGNEQMYFDSHFNLIPRDKCECDCWIFNE